MKTAIMIGAIVVVGALGYSLRPATEQSIQTSSAPAAGLLAEVKIPQTLSENAQIGQRAYEANCAACHGADGAGQNGVAPPLVHIIYEPNHHGDESFQRAAALGVQSHHWTFGNMPPVEGITRGDVTLIIAYIRELQRANGIN